MLNNVEQIVDNKQVFESNGFVYINGLTVKPRDKGEYYQYVVDYKLDIYDGNQLIASENDTSEVNIHKD